MIVLSAVAIAVASFLILTGQTPIQPTPIVVRAAGAANALIVLLLIGIVAYEAAGLWIARRRGRAASRLHVRIVLLFSFIAAMPAILMMVIASITLNKGLDRWFGGRVPAIIETSRAVAQAYVEEHSRMLALDLLAISGEFNRVTPDLQANAQPISSYLTNQAKLRGLASVQLIRRDRSLILEGETNSDESVPPAPESIFDQLDSGQPALIAPGTTNLVGGVLKLTAFDDVYLYLSRPLDPRVSRNLRLTEENAAEYAQLEASRFGVQVAFGIMFAGVALIVLLSAIWIGLGFARSLVSPIRGLIGAAQEIASGNLNVRVPVRGSAGDISVLAETFNTMTGQVKSQRDDLIAANEQMDQRRRFTAAVLSGVSAGVIGLDGEGAVTLVNRSALEVLGMQEPELVGKALGEAIPALKPVLGEAKQRGRGPARDQIHVVREGEQRTLNVQVTQERSGGKVEGLVVTLDDITDLTAAERRSAWADVARRIAHEIKNPLTPIQLSAQRLRRRLARAGSADERQLVVECTETIIQEVDG
ncbi:MAG: HAMP domain-containing protein, partial [Propylenella sp.]